VEPQTGEEFPSLEYSNFRLRAFALAEGFDIMRYSGGSVGALSYRFRYFYYGTITKNNRKLEDHMEVDKEGNITSNRKRNIIKIRQLNYP
jgi:hypothetical protein